MVEGVTLYREPHWTRLSPDRKYFASWVIDIGHPMSEHQGSQRYMIYVGSLDGDWTRVLSPNGQENFAWSPDGTRIAFTIASGRESDQGYLRARIRSTEIMVVGIDGSNYDCVLEYPGVLLVEDWSPDGKRLLLRHNSTAAWRHRIHDLLEFDLAAAVAGRERSYGKGRIARAVGWELRAKAYLRELLPGSSMVSPTSGRYSLDGSHIAVKYHDPAHTYSQREPDTNANRNVRLRRRRRVDCRRIDRAVRRPSFGETSFDVSNRSTPSGKTRTPRSTIFSSVSSTKAHPIEFGPRSSPSVYIGDAPFAILLEKLEKGFDRRLTIS